MTQTNYLFPQKDPKVERQRVLAKVYGLLMRLAEEAEHQAPLPEIVTEDEGSIVEPIAVQLELSI